MTTQILGSSNVLLKSFQETWGTAGSSVGGGGVMYYGVVSRHMLTKQNAHKTNAHKTNAHRSYAHTTNAHKTLCSQDIFTRHNAIKTNAHKNIIYTHNTRQMLNIHWETQIPVLASSRSGSKHPHGNQQRVFHKKTPKEPYSMTV